MLCNILENLNLGILQYDYNTKEIYMNGYMNIFNKLLDENMFLCKTYIHIEDYNINNNKDINFIKNKEASDNECRILNKDGNYNWYKIKRKFYKDIYLYSFDNIDLIKKLEFELIEAKIQSDNLYNHKGLFLASMSHEIRTPINGIIGMMTLLEDTVLSYDQKNYIEMLRECSLNLMTIINDILDYSKLEAKKVSLDNSCFDIRDCIESANDILSSKIHEKKIEYNYSFSDNTPYYIYSDYNRIKQIILNLLSNSIKFTEKGHIILNITSNYIDEDVFLKFSIIDTGCGIEKSEQAKLFDSFSQILNKENKILQGTGLGLAISKELINLMNGDIWIDWSEINKGTRFCFTIKTKKCELINDEKSNQDENILRNKSVFILDDRIVNRLSLAAMVQRWGMKVQTYSDPKEALYLLKTNDYDLGLVDICMHPHMNGKDFGIKLQESGCNIPLIAISSLGDNIDESNTIFKSHHTKPIKENKLKKTCISILQLSKYKYKEPYVKKSQLNEYISNNNLNNNIIKNDIRILLVEDVLINQRVVISFLAKIGYKNVDISDNGKQCLEMMKIKKYDIILLDIRMPIIDGTTVIKYIMNYYNNNIIGEYKLLNIRKPYVIAVTAYCLKEDYEKYISMGFDDYIPKPININALNICMNACIEKILFN